jgi:hypothetical protein
MNLKEGSRISSFIKNTDKIWEGIVLTRTDGIQTVLNEQTGRWCRISNLEGIKILNEDFTGTVSTSVTDVLSNNSTDNKNIKYPDLKQNFVQQIVGDDPKKAVLNAEKVLSNKSALTAGGQSLFTQANTTLTDKSEAPKNEADATKDFDSSMKDIAAKAKAAETGDPEDGVDQVKKMTGIEESLQQLHPSLQKYLEDVSSDDLYDYMRDNHESGKVDEDSWDIFKDCFDTYKNEPKEDKPTKKDEKSMNYENDDYLDIPEDIKSDVMADVLKYLGDHEEDIETKIKSDYELSDSDAEEFVIKGMELFISTVETEPKDSIDSITNSEVEKSFEDAIDKYDGPEDGILDYLSDTYEIEPGEAQKIVEKTKGNLMETISCFVDYVKNKLNEELNNKENIHGKN